MSKLTPKAPRKGDGAVVVASSAIPILALIWGMQSGNPYRYFVFLRIVVFLGAFIFAAIFAGQKRETLAVLFAGSAILFNPVIPIYLTRDTWLVIDAATIATFVVGFGLYLARLRKRAKNEC